MQYKHRSSLASIDKIEYWLPWLNIIIIVTIGFIVCFAQHSV